MKARLDYINGRIVTIVDKTEIKIDIDLTPQKSKEVAAALGFIFIQPPPTLAYLTDRVKKLENAIIESQAILSSVVSCSPHG